MLTESPVPNPEEKEIPTVVSNRGTYLNKNYHKFTEAIKTLEDAEAPGVAVEALKKARPEHNYGIREYESEFVEIPTQKEFNNFVQQQISEILENENIYLSSEVRDKIYQVVVAQFSDWITIIKETESINGLTKYELEKNYYPKIKYKIDDLIRKAEWGAPLDTLE